MSIKVVEGLPSVEKLTKEGIQVFYKNRSAPSSQSLSLLIVNLMPTKEVTELQLLRLLGNTPLLVDVDFVYMTSHKSKNISARYLEKYYKTFKDVKNQSYDGLIVTGAPVEHLAFNEVNYYEELNTLIRWSETHVRRRLFICWGAQFALNKYYGVRKEEIPEKLFGVFKYYVNVNIHPYLKGFNDKYKVPQSRYTQVNEHDVYRTSELKVLTSHPEYGPDIISTENNRDLFILGHLEYDRRMLEREYYRDINPESDIGVPINYYPNSNPKKTPILSWQSHATILYTNWIKELNRASHCF